MRDPVAHSRREVHRRDPADGGAHPTERRDTNRVKVVDGALVDVTSNKIHLVHEHCELGQREVAP